VANAERGAPTFSVVMPAHNASATIESSIRSVLLQTVKDFELIVVDDGSSDDTFERATSFNALGVRVIQQDRAGPSGARNAALAHAKGEFVSMIDSDDLWLPRYLEEMGKSLEDEPQAGLAYTDAWVLDDSTGRIRRTSAMAYERPPVPPPAEPREFIRLLVDRNFVFGLATVRRSVIEQVGGYDERLGYGEDFELWLRIVEAGFRAVRVPGTLAIYRKHLRSRTSDLQRAHEGVCTTYRVIVNEHRLDDEARAIARARYASWLRKLNRITRPTPVDRLRQLARPIKAYLFGRAVWLPTPPPDVAETLRACHVVPPAAKTALAAIPGEAREGTGN
jgi:glycosyltransferase involved in cell wall biosynthesis